MLKAIRKYFKDREDKAIQIRKEKEEAEKLREDTIRNCILSMNLKEVSRHLSLAGLENLQDWIPGFNSISTHRMLNSLVKDLITKDTSPEDILYNNLATVLFRLVVNKYYSL